MMIRRDPADDWMGDAACRGHSPDLWFPAPGDSASAERAKAVCRRCPVREDCLDFALREGMRAGIWGGYSERERRRLRRPGQAVR